MRSIKAQNILLLEPLEDGEAIPDGTIKLADFGHAQELQPDGSVSDPFGGTCFNTAPEVLDDKQPSASVASEGEPLQMLVAMRVRLSTTAYEMTRS